MEAICFATVISTLGRVSAFDLKVFTEHVFSPLHRINYPSFPLLTKCAHAAVVLRGQL